MLRLRWHAIQVGFIIRTTLSTGLHFCSISLKVPEPSLNIQENHQPPHPCTTGRPATISSVDARYGPSTLAMYLASGVKKVMQADVALINSGSIRGDKVRGGKEFSHHTCSILFASLSHFFKLSPPLPSQSYNGLPFTYADLKMECPFPSLNVVSVI